MYKRAPLVQPGDKFCFCCSSVKPHADFYRCRTKPDGLSSQCKPCARETSKQSAAIKRRLQAAVETIKARSGQGGLELPSDLSGFVLS